MEINGKLYVKVDDEQLDEIVVKHCQAALDVCESVLKLEATLVAGKSAPDTYAHIQNIIEYDNFSKALHTVIMYFGGFIGDEDAMKVDNRPMT